MLLRPETPDLVFSIQTTKWSFEGKYLGKMVYAELSEGTGSTTEDPRIISGSRNRRPRTPSCSFCGHSRTSEGGRRCGSWDPVPVLVEGGEQKILSEPKSEEQ
jgi:hypothetical protein